MFSVENDAVRYTWAGWYLFVVLNSLVGDTLILYASIKHKVFKMNKLIVTFIQHVAVMDLILSIVWVLPIAVSIIKRGSDVGIAFHYVRVYISYFCYPAGTLLILGMTSTKVLLLKYPLRAKSWSKKQAYKICAVIYTVSLLNPVSFLIVGKDDVYFDSRIYTFDYGFSSDTWNTLAPIISVILLLIPSIATILATIFLIRKAASLVKKDSQYNLRWQGIMTVVLAAAVYSISVLPLTVYSILEPFVKKNVSQPGPFHVHFFRIAFTFLTLNIAANFFIYTITVPGFRDFLVSSITGIGRTSRNGSSVSYPSRKGSSHNSRKASSHRSIKLSSLSYEMANREEIV